MKTIIVVFAFFFTHLLQAATLPITNTNLKPSLGSAIQTVWSGGATGDVCAPLDLPSYKFQSVQVSGTFGGGTVTIEGSNDGTTWNALVDSFNGSLAFTSAGFKEIGVNARYVRCNITAGTATGMKIVILSIR